MRQNNNTARVILDLSAVSFRLRIDHQQFTVIASTSLEMDLRTLFLHGLGLRCLLLALRSLQVVHYNDQLLFNSHGLRVCSRPCSVRLIQLNSVLLSLQPEAGVARILNWGLWLVMSAL